jgi:hypothetical protein
MLQVNEIAIAIFLGGGVSGHLCWRLPFLLSKCDSQIAQMMFVHFTLV